MKKEGLIKNKGKEVFQPKFVSRKKKLKMTKDFNQAETSKSKEENKL